MGILEWHFGAPDSPAPQNKSQQPDPNSFTFLGEVGAEQVVLGSLGQGLDVDGSCVSDGASKALHLLVPLCCVQGQVEICGDTQCHHPCHL